MSEALTVQNFRLTYRGGRVPTPAEVQAQIDVALQALDAAAYMLDAIAGPAVEYLPWMREARFHLRLAHQEGSDARGWTAEQLGRGA